MPRARARLRLDFTKREHTIKGTAHYNFDLPNIPCTSHGATALELAEKALKTFKTIHPDGKTPHLFQNECNWSFYGSILTTRTTPGYGVLIFSSDALIRPFDGP